MKKPCVLQLNVDSYFNAYSIIALFLNFTVENSRSKRFIKIKTARDKGLQVLIFS